MEIEDRSGYQQHVYSVKKETAKRLMEIKKKYRWRIEAIVNEALEDWIKKIEKEFESK